MKVNIQDKLVFAGVDILHVNFTLNKPCKSDQLKNLIIDSKPQFHIEEDNDSGFFIVNQITVKLEGYFLIQLTAMGFFSANLKQAGKELNDFIQINAPAIMFPYVRSFISTLTANCGEMIPTIIIPPMIFTGEIPRVVVNKGDDKPTETDLA